MLEPSLSPIAISVLKQRYLIRNEDGETIESPQLRFERVAKFIAEAEKKFGGDPESVWALFYTMMARGDFMPNTPCLVNAGRPNSSGQLSACFVLPVPDSMEGIFGTLRDMALVHKTGGGTGFSFSRLRPKNDFVRSTTGIASGPVSFMKTYDHVTECVKQSGIRRGANMGILRVDHPDIMDFINCKDDTNQITNFNISVGITNAFMSAWEVDGEYDLINPRTNLSVGRMRARDVWQTIIQHAWQTGEPGLCFIDRVNEHDPLAEHLGPIEATNPCGEVPLRAYDACTLGSINLANFFVRKKSNGMYGTIDFDRLGSTVTHAVRFLDNVLEMNVYPVDKIYEVTRASRKIGLGIMGWADLLVQLGIPYASNDAIKLALEVMRFVNAKAVEASEGLAEERNPFPVWEHSKWNTEGCKPRRNSTVTVIAPTGSISIIAGCSSGIEPLFALCQTRNQADLTMVDMNPLFEEVAEREGFYSHELMEHVKKTGSVQNTSIPDRWKRVFMVANEIDSAMHVKMQAAFQAHTEDAVSKTINLHNTASVDAVEAAYRLAWETGCKGITVYRDGCRQGQPLSGGTKEKEPVFKKRGIPTSGRRRGETISKKTAYGTVHVTINEHPVDGQPFEVFVEMGKSGSEVKAFTEALGRSISLLLSTTPSDKVRERIQSLIDQFRSIGGSDPVGFGANRVVSAPDGIARALHEYLANEHSDDQQVARDLCPECKQASLTKGGKCDLCLSCGYSKC